MSCQKDNRRFNRSSEHRKSLFRNMICSLIHHEILRTTVSKAKELRSYIEPLITRAKIDSISNRRIIFNFLRNRRIISKLFDELGPRFIKRGGGYTRIMKRGHRFGDRASMSYIELVDRLENHGRKKK